MITDTDIAQAIQKNKQNPSKEWQDATLKRLRAVSLENHVTDSSGMRSSLCDTVVSLVSYFFPTPTMKPVFLKTIGSLAAVFVLTIGTHAVANGATPENSFLYTLDRGFERAEIAFATIIGGKASVAHRHLAHAGERVTEIDVLLLHKQSSASVSLHDFLIETAYAQNEHAYTNANIHAHIKLLANDYRNSLNAAVRILEEIAEEASSASVTTKAQLAIAIEATTKALEKRLEVSAEAAFETDETVGFAVQETFDTTHEARMKAQRVHATVDVQIKKQNKIVICHKGNTITINAAAWAAHEKHGDVHHACAEEKEDTADENEEEDGEEQNTGRVINVHLETQLTICHKGSTITINAAAWAAHEKHGDLRHACVDDKEDTAGVEEEDEEEESDEKDEEEVEVELEEEIDAEAGVEAESVLKANGKTKGTINGNVKIELFN